MDLVAVVVADEEALELVEPGEGALDDPALSAQGRSPPRCRAGEELQLRSARTERSVREHSPPFLVPVDRAEAASGRRRPARDNCPALSRVARDSHAVSPLEATRHIRRKAHRLGATLSHGRPRCQQRSGLLSGRERIPYARAGGISSARCLNPPRAREPSLGLRAKRSVLVRLEHRRPWCRRLEDQSRSFTTVEARTSARTKCVRACRQRPLRAALSRNWNMRFCSLFLFRAIRFS